MSAGEEVEIRQLKEENRIFENANNELRAENEARRTQLQLVREERQKLEKRLNELSRKREIDIGGGTICLRSFKECPDGRDDHVQLQCTFRAGTMQ
jgi:predicted RNase H-like nuclease (RuvC/YqgF family)